jgi:hypothetical protein
MKPYRLGLLTLAWVCVIGCGDRAPARASSVSHTRGKESSAAALDQDALKGNDTLFVDTLSRAPDAADEVGGYIDSVFNSEVHESPRMGWFVGGRFLAEERHPTIQILSVDTLIVEGRFARIRTARERTEIQDKYLRACGAPSALAEYTLSTPVDTERTRALFLARSFPTPPRVGFRQAPISRAAAAAGHALLDSVPPSALYADSTVFVAGGGEYYSIHAAYDRSTKELLQSALVLHDTSGRVVAHSVETYSGDLCDGCGKPTLSDGLRSVYRIDNAFVFPGFRHPVLLLDTGTVEGRALSLITFTPAGKESSYRLYEYVVDCAPRSHESR